MCRGWIHPIVTLVLLTVGFTAVPAGDIESSDPVRSSAASENGKSLVLRHEAQDRDREFPENPGLFLDEIDDHLARTFGESETVFHEILSDRVHLDVLVFAPTEDWPFVTLVTSGMSDRPMQVPEGMEALDRAELILALPRDWPLDEESIQDEDHYWPIRWLKMIGRLPHDYETWIGYGHTIPNGDPAEPIANTEFTGVITLPAFWVGEDLVQLTTKSGETITFYTLMPIYAEEMALKLERGAETLEALFEAKQIGPVVNPSRPNVARDR